MYTFGGVVGLILVIICHGFSFQLGENVVFNFITVNFMYVIFAKIFNKKKKKLVTRS